MVCGIKTRRGECSESLCGEGDGSEVTYPLGERILRWRKQLNSTFLSIEVSAEQGRGQ